MLMMIAAALSAGQAAAPPPAAQTVITDAADGGLRDWRSVPGAPGELYVRDRIERWYRVRLTAACERDRPFAALSYTTDATGTFDRFSLVRFVSPGPVPVCGVTSIVRSATPAAFDSKAGR